jgi:hypothetical protein
VSRNLDSTLVAALSNQVISPVVLASLTFKSGPIYVWTGVGNLVFNGNTYVGVGQFGRISPISEGSDVKADGIEVILSGIGLSPFPTPGAPIPTPGLTPPVTVPTGQYVAYVPPGTADNGSQSAYGTSSATTGIYGGNGAMGMVAGGPFNPGTSVTFSGFVLPDLPAGAVIQNVYVTAGLSWIGTGDIVSQGSFVTGFVSPSSGLVSGQYTYLVGTSESAVTAASFVFELDYSLVPPGGGTFSNPLPIPDAYTISDLYLAVYYTLPTASSLVNDAMADYLVGAPAKIYFGLLADGALVGTPYLIFSGQIDQPTIDVSTQSSSITIALENKLSNLLRPTARRYTSADQHLAHEDDLGFNWVETLNDCSLKWGT